MNKILLVEDEKPIRSMLEFALKKEGYSVFEVENGADAEAAIEYWLPDLVLMDWMLPDISGIEIIKILKKNEHTKNIPVIMLTAKTEESHKVMGLEAGADDYITKPFSPRELIARIQAVLRRSDGNKQTLEILEAGELRIDMTCHEVTLKERSLDLGPTEFRLLIFMLENSNRVFSRESLLNQIWCRSSYVEERTVDVHILRLRKALAKGGYDKYIQTVRGIGYRFVFNKCELDGVA